MNVCVCGHDRGDPMPPFSNEVDDCWAAINLDPCGCKKFKEEDDRPKGLFQIGQPVSREPIKVIQFTSECPRCQHRNQRIADDPTSTFQLFRCTECSEIYTADFQL